MKKIPLVLSLLYAISAGARAGRIHLVNGETNQVALSLHHLTSFISFMAERTDGACHLRWIFGSEQRAAHFDIQRSYDAVVFTTIGRTPVKNSGTNEEYLFTDRSPLTGFAWYRLQSVDASGKTS
jgi:hypothetical protein